MSTRVETTVVEIGPGLLFLLTILLAAMKVTGLIDASWVWVLFPLWLPTALAIVISTLVLSVIALAISVALVAGAVAGVIEVIRK